MSDTEGRGPEGRHRRALERYRLLLRAWPREFRDRYGTDMVETFGRLLAGERERRGRLGTAEVWVGAVRDAVVGGTRERIRSAASGVRGAFSGGDLMGEFLGDLRFALRALVRRPILAGTAVLTLALGIGANAAIFSVVNGLLIRPLPYAEPDELVVLHAQHLERGWTETDMNVADAWDLRARAGVFKDLAIHNAGGFTLLGGDQPEVVTGVLSTPNIFSVLGVEPVLGRDFREDENVEGADAVAVISDGFWERRFARDPGVIGQTLNLDGVVTSIIGVMSPNFIFPEDRPDLWTLMRRPPESYPRNNHSWEVLARLEPGITEAQADLAVNVVSSQLAEEYPETNEGWSTDVTTLRRKVIGDIALQASVVLSIVVGFVLLMACVNVANLLLARANARRGELAVRAALGAGRGRIVRQLLTESAVLGGLGGVAGLGLAYVGNRTIVAGLPANTPPVMDFSLDGNVVVFTALAALASVLLFGLVPALQAVRGGAAALRSGRGAGQGRARSRFGSTLVVVQTALAMMLLVGGGVMVKSVVGLMKQDFGWTPEGVLTVTMTPPTSKYEDQASYQPFHDRVLEQIRAVPGVTAAGATQTIPLGGSNWSGSFLIPGSDVGGGDALATRIVYITPGYFDALGVELRRGRDVLDTDGSGDTDVVVVNETFVRRYFPTTDPIGQTLEWDSGTVTEIVGVVKSHVERGVDRAPEPAAYRPLAQVQVRRRQLAIRTAGDPIDFVESIKAAVWQVDPDQPVTLVRTMSELVEVRTAGFRLIAQLMAAFAMISLLLGAVGIYGVTAYSVGQRTNEIGIRMAMGADGASVRGMVVRQGMRKVAAGLAVGLALAYLMVQGMSGLLFGVSPRDPATFGAVFLTILLVTFAGSYLPARRASTVDPTRALAAD